MADEKKNKFDETSGLGFMRLIQFYNVISILFSIVALIFVKGSKVIFTFEVITTVILLLSQAAVIWLLQRRKIYSRQIIIGIECFELFVMLVREILDGGFDIFSYIFSAIPPVIVILYFAFSRRAKAVLVQPWSDMSLRTEQEERNRSTWDPKSAAFWMRLAIYFFAFSIIGHWMEMGVQILVINGLFPGTVAAPDSLTWRDSLNPFFIYGIAVAFCGLALYPMFLWLKKKLSRVPAYIASFFVNMTFCVVAELILGFLFNADYSAWDYRDQFLNFEGQICLLYSVAFGVMSSLITWFVYPMLENAFTYVNRDVFRIIFVVSVVLYLVIYATYNVDLDDLMPGSNLTVDISSSEDAVPESLEAMSSESSPAA